MQRSVEASFFFFGPRGTGKSVWVTHTFPKGLYLDLLDAALQMELLATPERLGQKIDAKFRRRVFREAGIASVSSPNPASRERVKSGQWRAGTGCV